MPIISTEPVTAKHTTVQSGYRIAFILVTSLFFLWGLANILNSALIAHFQPVFEISRAQALLVETAFYFGYFTIAIPAGLFMERFSYKKGILLGLVLYAVGALMFIPAAKLMTFGFFLIALYIIASGLAFLETAANPYVMILGKPESATQRLNFSQSFNGLALVVGPWIAGQMIFSGNEGAMNSVVQKQQAADAVILPYALLSGVVIFIALLFYFIRVPEPDSGAKLKMNKGIFKKKHLMFAVVAQLFYVGAQVGVWGITINFVTGLLPGISNETASKYYLLAGTFLFVSGRLIGTWLMSFIQPNRLLTIYAAIAVALCLVAIAGEGKVAVFAILGLNFFMSIMFPTIFALGVRELGEYTKLGSSFIIMSIVGGAILPPVMGLISDHYSLQLCFIVPAFCFVVVMLFGWSGYKIKA